MLSYRHAFHAGNFADVLKHLVQVEILLYLQQKDKPFVYIDTHAGAGIYSLSSAEAEKTAEYHNGIGAIAKLNWPELNNYVQLVGNINRQHKKHNLYPGSPAIAQHLLREQDRAILYELHPNDFKHLQNNMQGDSRVKVHNQDGFQGLLSSLPPQIKRGLVLIDPPYEIKTDYQTVVDTLTKAYRKFATGTYALWYPVVERERIDLLERQLKDSCIKNIQLFELGLSADTAGRGMTSAGMIVINPPWTLADKLAALLPKLAKQLGKEQGVWRQQMLVAE